MQDIASGLAYLHLQGVVHGGLMGVCVHTYTSLKNSVPSTDATFTATGPMVYGGLKTGTTLTSTGTFSYVTTYDPEHSFWAFGIAISPPASVRSRSHHKSHVGGLESELTNEFAI